MNEEQPPYRFYIHILSITLKLFDLVSSWQITTLIVANPVPFTHVNTLAIQNMDLKVAK